MSRAISPTCGHPVSLSITDMGYGSTTASTLPCPSGQKRHCATPRRASRKVHLFSRTIKPWNPCRTAQAARAALDEVSLASLRPVNAVGIAFRLQAGCVGHSVERIGRAHCSSQWTSPRLAGNSLFERHAVESARRETRMSLIARSSVPCRTRANSIRCAMIIFRCPYILDKINAEMLGVSSRFLS